MKQQAQRGKVRERARTRQHTPKYTHIHLEHSYSAPRFRATKTLNGC